MASACACPSSLCLCREGGPCRPRVPQCARPVLERASDQGHHTLRPQQPQHLRARVPAVHSWWPRRQALARRLLVPGHRIAHVDCAGGLGAHPLSARLPHHHAGGHGQGQGVPVRRVRRQQVLQRPGRAGPGDYGACQRLGVSDCVRAKKTGLRVCQRFGAARNGAACAY